MRDFLEKIKKKNQYNLINKFMHGKLCYKNSTLKNERSNSNVDIYNISNLPIDMLCYSIESMMVQCKIHLQPASRSKIPLVQNRATSTTK